MILNFSYLSRKFYFDFILQAENLILNIIGNDYKETGRCDFIVAKEKFLFSYASSMVLQKRSAYIELFNRGYVIQL